jgi:hypothetical protein
MKSDLGYEGRPCAGVGGALTREPARNPHDRFFKGPDGQRPVGIEGPDRGHRKGPVPLFCDGENKGEYWGVEFVRHPGVPVSALSG